MTFAELDRASGIPEPDPDAEGADYPLPTWYREIRDTPLEDLTLFDICRACAQDIHLTHVVPIALRLLQESPLVGEYYDGHLLSSLSKAPTQHWNEHREEARLLSEILPLAISLVPPGNPELLDLKRLQADLARVLEV